ncbi:MAG: QueT transporter family protein [Oscillospiraceae bacterium]|jgi:uncharacterized membrane protein|nr:QueT transporter family protein [Oscillospiraceae bacterium]
MNRNTRTLVSCALLAAAYAVCTVAFAPLSYGAIQIRFSEALTLLAVFSPWSVAAVGAGCLVSNFTGMLLGLTTALDVIVGPIATLLAAIMSCALRNARFFKLPVLSALMPVIFNGLIIGAMLTSFGAFTLPVFLFNAGSVALGESIACFALGLPLVYALERTKLDIKLFGAAPGGI